MSYEMTGKLYEKFDAIQRTQTFKVREFILEKTDEFNGKSITNYIKFQCTQDRTGIVDKVNAGEQVKVHFNIRGNRLERNGQVTYFTNLEAWRIEQSFETANPPQEPEQSSEMPGNSGSDTADDLPF